MTVLDQRAEVFNRMVLDDALDEYGLIRHQLTYPERGPIPDDQLAYAREDREWRQQQGLKWHPLQGTPAYAMYEDANYVGNRYLVAMVWRWLAERNQPPEGSEPSGGSDREEARQAAEVGYQATLYPYVEGAKRERGYWPKPYGALQGDYAVDRVYTETSLDQAYSPVIALWRYAQHVATDAEKAVIGEALQAHGHWWIKHNYSYDYLGEVWKAFGDRIGSPSALKLPIGMHIAYQMTGDTQLRDEAVRILRQAKADGALRMHRGPRGEIKELYHWAEIYDYFMRDTDLADEADWSRLIEECWRTAKSSIQSDGLCIGQGFFRDDGLLEPYTPGPVDDVHHGYWKTDARHPASTAQMACLAMLVQELGYDPDAGTVGRRLLEAVREEHTGTIRGYVYTHPEQMPPAFRDNPPPPLFATRTVVFWLDAYWRGRMLGVL